MLEERARVLSIGSHSVWVEADRQQGCAKCEAGEGCGGGMLTKLVKRGSAKVEVLNALSDLHVGDDVVIGLDETALLKSSLMVYLLPVVSLFAFAGFAELVLEAGDLIVAAMGMLGLATGFLCLRSFSSRTRSDRRYQPVVLRKAEKSVSGCQVYVPQQDK